MLILLLGVVLIGCVIYYLIKDSQEAKAIKERLEEEFGFKMKSCSWSNPTLMRLGKIHYSAESEPTVFEIDGKYWQKTILRNWQEVPQLEFDRDQERLYNEFIDRAATEAEIMLTIEHYDLERTDNETT